MADLAPLTETRAGYMNINWEWVGAHMNATADVTLGPNFALVMQTN